MKYIIDVPDEHTDIKVFYTDADMKIIQSMRCEPYTEPDRKAIENEVWEFAGKIFEMNTNTYAEIYDKGFNSYRDAKDKYEAWMKEKEEEIRVGDEVTKGDALGNGFVTRIDEYKDANIIWEMGGTGCVNAALLKKTGRHFPEVATLLQMRGEKQ